MINTFNIKTFPSLVGISDPNSYYTGKYNRDKLEKWIQDFISSNIKTETSKNSVKELTKSLAITGKCGPGDSKLCLIWFMERDDKISLEIIASLADTFSKDNIEFFWVDKMKFEQYANSFNASGIILRGKRKKFIEVDCELNIKCMSDIIALAVSGGGEYKKIDTIPEFIENINIYKQ